MNAVPSQDPTPFPRLPASCLLLLPGRASFELTSLRYASLTAGSFSSSMRWEGDVVKLEETVLTQANSR